MVEKDSPKTIQKECSIHGTTFFHLYKDRNNYRYRCSRCRTDAVIKRRKKLKEMAIEYKGGKCSICNYNKCVGALEFHHIDSSKKEFGISKNGLTHSWDKIKNELDKCILVCSNCHKEIHEKE